jgi:predicted amidohydrolase
MRVAALQLDTVWEDREANLKRIEPWLAAAAGAGARLAVLPEMFPCGFTMAAERVAEPPEGPSTRFLSDQAREKDLWIAGSVPERPAGEARPFNTFLLAGPGGELVRYRKIHPFSGAGEHVHYAAGRERVIAHVEGVRLALFVCYDLRFADELWALAPDVDGYLVVASWPDPRRRHWQVLLEARAIENLAYVVGVNRVGEGGGLQHSGDSRIIDPMGHVLAAASGGETMLLAELDPARVAEVRRSLPFLRDRHPEGIKPEIRLRTELAPAPASAA